ncbi:hypothetical protein SRABI106_02865 [Rahnella aquatilis]|nr:hypothetical protein SRABI106_02865 [Rahnella aquatilis]
MKNFAIVEAGVVTNVILWNGEAEWSPEEGQTVIEVKAGVEAGIGYSIVDGEFVAPATVTPSKEELIVKADKQKQQILQSVNTTTQMWQTQLTLGIITNDDKEALTAWMKYAQSVNAVDTSASPNITWPSEPS